MFFLRSVSPTIFCTESQPYVLVYYGGSRVVMPPNRLAGALQSIDININLHSVLNTIRQLQVTMQATWNFDPVENGEQIRCAE